MSHQPPTFMGGGGGRFDGGGPLVYAVGEDIGGDGDYL